MDPLHICEIRLLQVYNRHAVFPIGNISIFPIECVQIQG